MDVHSKTQRSFNMSRINSVDTKIEILFRKYLWSHGIRGYRLHSGIIGKPDLYFPKYRLAIFIDGCFWHKCKKCFVRPKTNVKFWVSKIDSNVNRDKNVNSKLKNDNIRVLRFWEHEINKEVPKCFKKLIKVIKT